MTGTNGLERAIRDWVNSFATCPAGESKPIRLSADSVALHRVKDFGSEWSGTSHARARAILSRASRAGQGGQIKLVRIVGLLMASLAVAVILSSPDARG